MKTLADILLSLVILVQPLSKLMVVAEYQVNKNFIAEFLCVNKSKPQLHCEGKCQLSKKLKAVEEHDENHLPQGKTQADVLFFYQPAPTFSFKFPSVSATEYISFSSPDVTAPVFGFFHPPCFLI